MLIRAQTTEDRIGEIANKFASGISGYAQSQQQEAAQTLQAEALRRQKALQAFEMADKISATTGKVVTPDMLAPSLASGDLSGIGEILKSAPLSQKSQQTIEDRQLDRRFKESQINKNNRPSSAPKENLTYREKLQLKADMESQKKSTPEAKLEGLGAEGRSKVGSIASGFQALDQMEKASNDGHGPQHIDSNSMLIGGLISDNPYSEAERTTAEVIGRLQSGGAMSENEVKTFKSLGPRPGDDLGTRKRKLSQQKDFLQNKLVAFGLDSNDLTKLGFETVSRYEPRNQPKGVSPNVNQNHVNTVKSMSDEELLRFVQGG